MKNILFVPLLFISLTVFPQTELLNNTYPLLTFSTLLQSPVKNATAEYFDGKTIVLEFWATWCSPCLANVKHLNELQSDFADSVLFISITDEPKEKIETFLKKRKINGWIACDTAKNMHQAYHVQGIPRTVIIDKNGIVIYDGRPENVDTTLLSSIINGGYVPEKKKQTTDARLFGAWSGGDDPVFTANFRTPNRSLVPYQHIIRPTVMPQGGGSGWRDFNNSVGITIINAGIPKIFSLLMNLSSPVKVINHSKVNDTACFDIIFSRSNGYTLETAKTEILNSIGSTFDIKWRDTVINTTVLTAMLTDEQHLMAQESIDWNDPSSKSYYPLSGLLKQLENSVGSPVEYEAEMDTQYIDTFEIFDSLYTMPANDLQSWLTQKGVQFQIAVIPVKKVWLY